MVWFFSSVEASEASIDGFEVTRKDENDTAVELSWSHHYQIQDCRDSSQSHVMSDARGGSCHSVRCWLWITGR